MHSSQDASGIVGDRAKVAELEEQRKAAAQVTPPPRASWLFSPPLRFHTNGAVQAEAQAKQAAATSAAEKKAAEKAEAKANFVKKAKKTGPRTPPKGDLDMSDEALEEAYQKVSDDADDTDWAWYTLTGDGKKMRLMETGDDGLVRSSIRHHAVAQLRSALICADV